MTMTPAEVIAEMRDIADDKWEGFSPAVTIERWADALERAMREPTAKAYSDGVFSQGPDWKDGTLFFTLPPNAVGIINEQQREASYWQREYGIVAGAIQSLSTEVNAKKAEIERLQNKLVSTAELLGLTRADLDLAQAKIERLKTDNAKLRQLLSCTRGFVQHVKGSLSDEIKAALAGKEDNT